MKLKNLSILTGVLFLISIAIFVNENKRGTDLTSGSDYIKGLDIGSLHKIVIGFNKDKSITLTRDSNRFVLESHKSYPAATDKVNDLIYKISNIQIKEKVAKNVDDDELKKYELDENSKKYIVKLYDNNDKETVSFRVGKTHKNGGNYLYKVGQKEVYLSQSNVWLNSSYKDFVNTALLKINSEDIQVVDIQANSSMKIVKKDKEYVFEEPNNKKLKPEKTKDYIKGLSNILFEEYYTPDDTAVSGLIFKKKAKLKLRNKLMYKISLAQDKDEYFAKLNVTIDNAPEKIVIHSDDGKDKLQEVEDLAKAQTLAQRINLDKGRWIYKIDKTTYKKLVKDLKSFM